VKAKCIIDCRVKAKPTDAKVVEKEVKEANDEKNLLFYMANKLLS